MDDLFKASNGGIHTPGEQRKRRNRAREEEGVVGLLHGNVDEVVEKLFSMSGCGQRCKNGRGAQG
jgi:hypothetical protein